MIYRLQTLIASLGGWMNRGHGEALDRPLLLEVTQPDTVGSRIWRG